MLHRYVFYHLDLVRLPWLYAYTHNVVPTWLELCMNQQAFRPDYPTLPQTF